MKTTLVLVYMILSCLRVSALETEHKLVYVNALSANPEALERISLAENNLVIQQQRHQIFESMCMVGILLLVGYCIMITFQKKETITTLDMQLNGAKQQRIIATERTEHQHQLFDDMVKLLSARLAYLISAMDSMQLEFDDLNNTVMFKINDIHQKLTTTLNDVRQSL